MSSNDYRYERKYPTQLEFETLQSMVTIHPSLFVKEYPDRWINNIYFDDSNYSLYQKTVHGLYHRKKIRVRWYHQISNCQKINLEIKLKHGYLGHKKINHFNFKNNYLDSSTRIDLSFLDQINKKSPSISSFKPVIFNRYLRSYYKSKLNPIRLTIDRKVQFAPIYNGQIVLKNTHQINLRIIELKYNNQEDNVIPEIANHLPLKLNRCSKYGMGLNIFYGQV